MAFDLRQQLDEGRVEFFQIEGGSQLKPESGRIRCAEPASGALKV
jgi:hypothetical protein